MSDLEQGINEQANDLPELSELDVLKARAKMLGITFSNNIGVDALRARIEAAQEEPKQDQEQLNPLAGDKAGEKPAAQKSLRQQMVDEQMKLVRLRITNLDPKKKDLPGEILTVANEYLGTVRKFIPFGEVTDGGFHVPFCLYTMMKDRKFLDIRVRKDRRTGTTFTEQRWVSEFALEILDPLTPKEIDDLAKAQMAAGSIE